MKRALHFARVRKEQRRRARRHRNVIAMIRRTPGHPAHAFSMAIDSFMAMRDDPDEALLYAMLSESADMALAVGSPGLFVRGDGESNLIPS